MKIVDAQVHMWAAGPPSGHHRQVPRFAADELLPEMAAAGVDAALIHPHLPWDPGANELACAAALERPHRFAVLGQLALERPESRALIDTWRDRPGMLGLRFSLTRPEEERWHVDGTMDWLWPAAERAGLPVATMAWRFLPTLASIAERHPALRLIIDHCGLVRAAKGEAAFANLDQLLAVARLPNVALKATGAPGYSTAAYPFRDIHDGLRRIYDAFGPDRFFWGTDLTRMPCTYRECVAMFTEELSWLRGAELAKVMGAGLCDWIGWRGPFEATADDAR